MSTANITPTLMELTPCRVSFNSVDLGGTTGNVKVSLSTEKAEIKADQLGSTIIDRVVSGFTVKIETVLAEISNKDNWKVVFPVAKRSGTGPYNIYFDSQVGTHDYPMAQQLILHPLSRVDSDKAGDYLFFKAVAESVSEVTFGPTEQQGLKVVWNVYPDFSVTPARYLIHGDPTIGIVNASFVAPVYTGTGNGVMSAVSVNSNLGGTKTETITVSCVGVPAANQSNWIVSGSISGPIGNFSITSGSYSFASNVINFVLSDGTADFVIGDQFVIATTAANFI